MIQLIMQKKLFQIFNLSIIVFTLIFLSTSTSLSKINIFVSGNKNISSKTIKSLIPDNLNILSKNDVNNFRKIIFNTGFFENVNLKFEDNNLYIQVIENPIINFFFIEGIKQKILNDKIYEISNLKENKIFQPYLIKEDLSNISNYLKNIGYLNNKVYYKLKKIDNSKINLFYEIDLNYKFKINRIFFIGSKYYNSSTLQNVIFSSEHGWWKFFSNSTTPTEANINNDISKLKKFYLDNGFYDVQINSSSIKVLDNGNANIIYSIDAGKKYHISNVNLIDNSGILTKANINFLKKNYKNLNNETYNQYKIQKTLDFTTNYLVKNSFYLIV